MRQWALCLLAAPAIAAAEPKPLALTATQQRHELPTVVAGAHGWLVAWQELAPTGADDRPWKLAAAIVDDRGAIAVPAKVLAEGARADELHAAWNGKAFTIVTCAGTRSRIAWGELALDGTYTPRGDELIAGHVNAFTCEVVSDGGHVVVIATSRAERRGGHEQVVWKTCKTRRVVLEGERASVGPENRLCFVWAAEGQWMLGPDANDHAMLVDSGGKTVRLALDALGATAAAGTFAARTPANDDRHLAIQWLAPPEARPARAETLDAGPFQPRQDLDVLALAGGGLALVGAGAGAERIAPLVTADPPLPWQVPPGGQVAFHLTFLKPPAGTAIFTVLGRSFAVSNIP
ncbi:MAG: hypothetical protein ACM31C_14190 [Acidobacteriota bacterium]